MASSAGPSIAVIDDHELVREGLASLISGGETPAGQLVYCGDSPSAAALAAPPVRRRVVSWASSLATCVQR